jgi:GNAT superfamily N-acetyltransferase
MDQRAQPRLLAVGGAARGVLALPERSRQTARLLDRHDDARHALYDPDRQSYAAAGIAFVGVYVGGVGFLACACLVDSAAVSKVSEAGPTALIIRPAELSDARAIAKVQVDTWRTTYRGIMSSDFLAALSYEQREADWRRVLSDLDPNRLGYVATDDSESVIGFIHGGPEREGRSEYGGEIYAIYVLEAFQRRAVGRRLTATLAQKLIDTGLLSLLVWVLEENRFRAFYEALGGQLLGQKQITVGGGPLVEVAYGWRNARVLIENCSARAQ